MKNKRTIAIIIKMISCVCILVFLLFLIGCTNKTIKLYNSEGNLTFSIQDLKIEKTKGAFGLQEIIVKGICVNESNKTYSGMYIVADFFDKRGEKLDTKNSRVYSNIKEYEKFPFEINYINVQPDIDIDKTELSIARK